MIKKGDQKKGQAKIFEKKGIIPLCRNFKIYLRMETSNPRCLKQNIIYFLISASRLSGKIKLKINYAILVGFSIKSISSSNNIRKRKPSMGKVKIKKMSVEWKIKSDDYFFMIRK